MFFVVLAAFANAQSKDTLKVLMIGNSFADDCAEYIDDIAIAADRPLIIGVLYRGGCSLQRHVSYIENDASPYDYRKRVLGVYTNTPKTSLISGLTDEKWDVITIQQQSFDASSYDTYYPYITTLLNYVNQHKLNADAELYFVQTWAYGKDLANKPKHKNGAKFLSAFGGDQMAMYKAIAKVSKRICKENELKVIPAGTAIQNARGALGDVMTRDGYHLDKQIGRYVAACAMLETLSRGSLKNNDYRPEKVDEKSADYAKKAAVAAVSTPYKVSKLK